MPVQGTVKTIVPRCWRWLGNCCLRPKAPVPCHLQPRRQQFPIKSSPAPRDNSFDCSLNRPKATVPKSSPAPMDNSVDCSLNRHEITDCILTHHHTILGNCENKTKMVIKLTHFGDRFWCWTLHEANISNQSSSNLIK
jgi:hypothetical protein